jgi:methionyl-tRNA formyltransferase
MRIVILTANRRGTAAYCLPDLLDYTDAEIVHVIYSAGRSKKNFAFYRKKLRKMLRIGLPGALNGIRIRNWFSVSRIEGREIEDLETLCNRRKIPFTVVPLMNGPEAVALMTSLQPDLALSLGNSYLSKKLFSVPRYGMLNIHGEVLPDFQNAQSVIWQLYEGSMETGYTIHKIDGKIDTGDILLQEKFPILFRDTLSETVSASCADILRRASAGLVETIRHFQQYEAAKRPQGKGRTYTTPTLRQFMRILANFNKLKKEQKR